MFKNMVLLYGLLALFIDKIQLSTEYRSKFQLDHMITTDHQYAIFRIKEESSNGTLVPGVGEFLLHFAMVTLPNPDFDTTSYHFQLLGIRDQLTSALYLHPNTGEMSVIGRIDRESLCPNSVKNSILSDQMTNPSVSSNGCIKEIEVLVTSNVVSAQSDVRKITIKLHIEDINDNSPQWPPAHVVGTYFVTESEQKLPVIEVRLLENAKDSDSHSTTTATVPLPLAHDPDEGVNGVIKYHLKPENRQSHTTKHGKPERQQFELSTSATGTLELIATGNLDYETQKVYQMYLIAEDSGEPVRSTTALVKVNLIDVNDEAPVFTEDVFYPATGPISEKAQIGSIVLNLSATDADASIANNRLRYSMVSNQLASEYFTVHSDGKIILRHQLDYESMEFSNFDSTPEIDLSKMANTKKWFAFQVEVTDSAPAPYEKTGHALVVIPVKDENDEAPVITVKFFGTPEATNNGRMGAIIENGTPPIRLAYIQVRDPDFDGQDRVNCQLSNNDNFSLTPIQSVPTGQQNPSLVPQTQSDFLLNLLVVVDRERTPVLQVSIKCLDEASNANEQKLHIRVLDVNDESPSFTQNVYHFSLPENSEPNHPIRLGANSSSTVLFGYRVGRVLAHDKDVGDNARLIYQLDSSSLQIFQPPPSVVPNPASYQGHHVFYMDQLTPNPPALTDIIHVDEKTGVIYALKSFDAENIGRLQFVILAIDQPTDAGSTSLTGMATVDVIITDMNDCDPIFFTTNFSLENSTSFGARPIEPVNQYVFHVKENQPAYFLVGHITAFDPDIGIYNQNSLEGTVNTSFRHNNVNLRLSPLTDVESRKTFSLHQTSGQLRTLVPLDRETKAVYMFTVIATDSIEGKSSLERSATATVTVFVDDENDNDPVFVRPVASSRKNSPSVPPSKTPINEPTFEKKSYVTTSRHEQNKQISDRSVPIVLVHKNTWNQQLHKGMGIPLLQLEATDADTGENGRVNYRIGSGNSDNLFSVDSNTGTLMFSPLVTSRSTKDVHSKSSDVPIEGKHVNYLLRFEACDNGVPQRCALPIWVRMVLNIEDIEGLIPINQLKGEITDEKLWTRSDGPVEAALQYLQTNDVILDHNQYHNWNTNYKLSGDDRHSRPDIQYSVDTAQSQLVYGNAWTANLAHTQNSKSHPRFTHEMTGNKFGTPYQPGGMVVSEAVIVCLAIIFVILLAAASILFCLFKKKILVYTMKGKRKINIKSMNQINDNTIKTVRYPEVLQCCQPMETDPSYHSPNATTSSPEAVEDGTKNGFTEIENLTNRNRNAEDAISLQSFARGTAEQLMQSRVRNLNSIYMAYPVSSLHTSQMVEPNDPGHTWYHNAYPTPFANRRLIPRSVTPIWEIGQENTLHVDGSMFIKPEKSHSFHTSPRRMYQVAHDNTTNPTRGDEEMIDTVTRRARKKDNAIPSYVCVSPTMDKALHLRSDSLPVYPIDQCMHMSTTANWPNFEPTIDHAHTYQELSALTASLPRHPKAYASNRRNLKLQDNRPSVYNFVGSSCFGPSHRLYYPDDRTKRCGRNVSRSPILSECDEHVALLNDRPRLARMETFVRNTSKENECKDGVAHGPNTELEESQISQTVNNTESSSTSGIISDQTTAHRIPGPKYVYDAYNEASFV